MSLFPQAQEAFSMGEAILEVLTQIRDQEGEGAARQETFMVIPFAFDVSAGGVGQAEFTLPGGVGYLFSSMAVEATVAGGRVTVYAGGVSPSALLQTVDIPAALVAGTARASKTFGENDYAPPNTKVTVLVEGAGGAYRMAGVIRGKAFLAGDAHPTTHSD